MSNQITGLSGEYFVAAELLKRNFQVALTIGTAKAIDLIAINEAIGKTYKVQVKTLRKGPNCFTLHTSKIIEEAIYFFVYLNKKGIEPTYFILTGQELLERPEHFYGSSLGRQDKRETVNHGPLQEYKNRWSIMENVNKN